MRRLTVVRREEVGQKLEGEMWSREIFIVVKIGKIIEYLLCLRNSAIMREINKAGQRRNNRWFDILE